jgi:predicted solute-binding protein
MESGSIHWGLSTFSKRYRVGSVGYLNPVPLVWGMLHGPQQDLVDLSFSIPSVCSRELETGKIEIGLVPVAEIARQGLEIVPGVGITCFGPVRSILLISKRPIREIKTFAVDSSSRTSVQLAGVVLRERYGVTPKIAAFEPDLERMLSEADAALIIGDPALLIDPATLPYECLDLGEEWRLLTGLPMVFAAWGGKRGLPFPALEKITRASYAFGAERMDEIIEQEHPKRGISRELATQYLKKHIRYVLGVQEEAGLEAFLELADLPRPTLAGRA